MEITYYLASSIDGFIATNDGDVSWMDELGIAFESSGYDDFYSTIDGLIMGRKTYQFIQDYGSWPYEDKPAWVCSTTETEAMDGCNLQAESSPVEAVKAAEEAGLEHLWCVGGGVLASALLQHDLLDRLLITQLPIVLGSGIPMFATSQPSKKLKLEISKTYVEGYSQSIYRIEKEPRS